MECTACRRPLVKPAGETIWRCPVCEGAAVTVEALRAYTDSKAFDGIMAAAHDKRPGDRRCARCPRNMVVLVAPSGDTGVELDLCWPCRLIWFDPGELATLPSKGTPAPVPERTHDPFGPQRELPGSTGRPSAARRLRESMGRQRPPRTLLDELTEPRIMPTRTGVDDPSVFGFIAKVLFAGLGDD